jgi:Domain of unknown function (DUF4259)
MAAWGGGPFENDRAFYWAVSLKDSSDLGLVRETISLVMQEGYVETNEGFRGIAACEAVAIIHGAPPPASELVPEEVFEWAQRLGPARDLELVREAVEALDQIEGNESELGAIWVEANDTTWAAKNGELRGRLQRLLELR